MKLKVKCDFCGNIFEWDECHLKGKSHHFCSRKCLAAFSNKILNPDAKLTNFFMKRGDAE